MSSTLQKQFGKRLRSIRERKGMTQLQLAKKTGIMNVFISVLESGQKEPCLNTLDTLARGLGVSLSTLVRGL